MTTGQVDISTDAALIVAANPSRDALILETSDDCFIGGPAVTATTGLLLKAGIPKYLTTTAAVYAITASGDATVSFCDQEDLSHRGGGPIIV